MLDVGGAAWAFDNIPPRGRSSTRLDAEEAPAATIEPPQEIEGVGAIVDNAETKIAWGKGLKDQNGKWEDYYGEQNPDAARLPPGSKTFDFFKEESFEAISNKTLNTQSLSYIRNPEEIYNKLVRYVDDAVNYEPYKASDLDPALIETKTIQLAIPEYTSPMQWRYLLRAIIYGKDNGVSIVITRIRE
jgi:filamentous hemagglutinin